MPRASLYEADDGRTYTPETFVAAYNAHEAPRLAADAMGIELNRLLVIASRLRKRGFEVRRYNP